MTSPFIGQVSTFSFNFAPKGWLTCSGQTLSISQYQALFALLGNKFGGDGQTSFALPNMNGAAPLGSGSGYAVGQAGGEANHTLAVGEMPSHTHSLNADANTPASSNGSTPGPGLALGQSTGTSTGSPPTFAMNVYNGTASGSALNSGAVGPAGGQPHSNMMPSLGLNFCIAVNGIFPPRS